MASNEELLEKMSLDLGVDLINRRPTAKMLWKWQDIDLLPHASADTLLGEIYSWSGRNWRTTQNNIVGIIFPAAKIPQVKTELVQVKREHANIPDFEFAKDDLTDLDFSIPSLFDIKLKGEVKNVKDFYVKVNGVTKSRLTNIDQPGISIYTQLSTYAKDNSTDYREKLKNDHIVTALFYAESVEINLEKDAGVNVELGFKIENVDVETVLDTATKKKIVLKYKGDKAPFAATLVKVKKLDD